MLPLFLKNKVISFYILQTEKGPAGVHPGAADYRAVQPGGPGACRNKPVTNASIRHRCCPELMSEALMNGVCQGNAELEAQSSLLLLAVCVLAHRSGD